VPAPNFERLVAYSYKAQIDPAAPVIRNWPETAFGEMTIRGGDCREPPHRAVTSPRSRLPGRLLVRRGFRDSFECHLPAVPPEHRLRAKFRMADQLDRTRAVISSFTANPTTVAAGQSVTLSWSTSNALYSIIDPQLGPVRGTSAVVTPQATTTYTLYATNQFGRTTASVTVTVQ
jgi:hypothetical protein